MQSGVTVGSKFMHKTQTCPAESQKEGGGGRKCEGAGAARLTRTYLDGVYPTLSSFDTHTHTHTVTLWPRYQHTQAEFTPLLLLLWCSGSTLFCNAVMQSHQLFIKDFCSWSVTDRQTWKSTGTFDQSFSVSVRSQKTDDDPDPLIFLSCGNIPSLSVPHHTLLTHSSISDLNST